MAVTITLPTQPQRVGNQMKETHIVTTAGGDTTATVTAKWIQRIQNVQTSAPNRTIAANKKSVDLTGLVASSVTEVDLYGLG